MAHCCSPEGSLVPGMAVSARSFALRCLRFWSLEFAFQTFSGCWMLEFGCFLASPHSPLDTRHPTLYYPPHRDIFMAEIRRATLFGKLNPIAYKAIESATVFCKMRGNPYVESLHWLHQLLQSQD